MNKEQLFKWRTDRSLKQTELANLAGISPSYLSSIESGYSPITKKVDRKLSRAMELFDNAVDISEPSPEHKEEVDSEWVREQLDEMRKLEEIQRETMVVPPPGTIWHVEQGEPKPAFGQQAIKSAPIDKSDRKYLKNGHAPTGDARYIKPKVEPDESLIREAEELLRKNEIYRRIGSKLHTAQRRQIMYGMVKYPEPLNQDTWSELETIDHIIDESIDQLHYLMMLRIKLEQNNIHQEE